MAIAVAVMVTPILIVTLAASLWGAIALWAAAVLVFLLHFGVHLGADRAGRARSD